jgi:hypothetical protein
MDKPTLDEVRAGGDGTKVAVLDGTAYKLRKLTKVRDRMAVSRERSRILSTPIEHVDPSMFAWADAIATLRLALIEPEVDLFDLDLEEGKEADSLLIRLYAEYKTWVGIFRQPAAAGSGGGDAGVATDAGGGGAG